LKAAFANPGFAVANAARKTVIGIFGCPLSPRTEIAEPANDVLCCAH
jgi:hypothetical protein